MLGYFRRVNEKLNRLFFAEYSEYQRRYQSLICPRVRGARVTLDLGAGRRDVRHFWELEGQAIDTKGVLIAVDLDVERLGMNPNGLKVAADGCSLPFRGSSIDLIVTLSMMEHLERPAAVLAEVGRVLKRGGAMVFATPQRFSYISIVAAMTPLRFHHWFYRMHLDAGNESDCCQTLYRLNTVRDIRRCAHGANLVLAECTGHVGGPCYTLSLPPPLHFLFVLFHKLVEQSEFTRRSFGVNLVGVLEKP